MTNDDSSLQELPPSEQPPTDDPWVIVTPMPRVKSDEAVDGPKRRRWPCKVCGAYWACEHEAVD